eukprot:364724-Chlamydomonas_euryale.AAC.8
MLSHVPPFLVRTDSPPSFLPPPPPPPPPPPHGHPQLPLQHRTSSSGTAASHGSGGSVATPSPPAARRGMPSPGTGSAGGGGGAAAATATAYGLGGLSADACGWPSDSPRGDAERCAAPPPPPPLGLPQAAAAPSGSQNYQQQQMQQMLASMLHRQQQQQQSMQQQQQLPLQVHSGHGGPLHPLQRQRSGLSPTAHLGTSGGGGTLPALLFTPQACGSARAGAGSGPFSAPLDGANVAALQHGLHPHPHAHVRTDVPPPGCAPDAVKLFVGGIPKCCTEGQLLPIFSALGTVVDLIVVRDTATRKSKGSAFVW